MNTTFSTSAAAWKSAQLLQHPDFRYQLTQDDINEINHALNFVNQKEIKLLDITEYDFSLPTLGKKLKNFVEVIEHGIGVILVQGLPISEYSITDAQKILWGIGTYLGTTLSQSPAGEHIMQLRDDGYKLYTPKARGTNTSEKLGFHTDSCDIVAMLSIQNALSGGESTLVSAIALYKEIGKRDPKLLKTLCEPFYFARPNFLNADEDIKYYPMPIFTECQGYFASRYLRYFIELAQQVDDIPKLTTQQISALNLLDEISEDPEFKLTLLLEPGDFLFSNNFVTYHGRESFKDGETEEQKRLLYRLWLSHGKSRPLSPVFEEIYGDVSAGAVRGGVR